MLKVISMLYNEVHGVYQLIYCMRIESRMEAGRGKVAARPNEANYSEPLRFKQRAECPLVAEKKCKIGKPILLAKIIKVYKIEIICLKIF